VNILGIAVKVPAVIKLASSADIVAIPEFSGNQYPRECNRLKRIQQQV
jgi:hypothetical protein